MKPKREWLDRLILIHTRSLVISRATGLIMHDILWYTAKYYEYAYPLFESLVDFFLVNLIILIRVLFHDSYHSID